MLHAYTPDSFSPTNFSRAHVIIVDDEAPNRIMLSAVCRKLGIGIINEASTGTEAFQLIQELRPDLVLLDIRMPQMDGMELMQKLRAANLTDGLAILVQTSLQDAEDRVKCFALGATDVISRPLHPGETEARIKAHLQSALAARLHFDFRNRIKAHIEITRAFLDAILPNSLKAAALAGEYGYQHHSFYRPHDEVGGDLWSILPIDDNWMAIIIADASAHGLAGAINALRVDCLIQENHILLSDPAAFIMRLDQAMAKISFGQLFAGLFAGIFQKDTGLFRYAGSGLPPPLLRRGTELIPLKIPGLPAGSGLLTLETAEAQLNPDDVLAMATDGWRETMGEDQIRRLFLRGHPPWKNALPAADDQIADDITLVFLQRAK